MGFCQPEVKPGKGVKKRTGAGHCVPAPILLLLPALVT